MSPIARSVIRFTQRIKNSARRNQTLDLIKAATKQPDLAHFTIAMCNIKPSISLNTWLNTPTLYRNLLYTSYNEPRSYATVLLATQEQADTNKLQVIHIFYDADRKYAGHELFPERTNKITDK
ncbi:uncharacterized protein K489DRAFT_324771 [Dissoconium aciculare CBS 342.82]|uniref:Uncharacterized protein n=1 Tax=Dissoconium aciculare CBS 342.82 TaxID=1314786 RepID=A0A6J3LYH8_9PEZI|nr:uncharacterized protein K489DRAFT_324771 [Dissoconium aciculare CBS 342.82]KAF1819682.1 hypothetical protein K489DRAFT_324771 [Dissoconium aciculare CBS 342.82]